MNFGVEQIEKAITELEQSADVSAEQKQQATENYRAALQNLKSVADHESRLKVLVAEAEAVGQQALEYKQQLARLKDLEPEVDTSQELSQLEQLLPTIELQLSSFKKTRKSQPPRRLSRAAARRKEIRARMTELQEKIDDANAQLKTLTSSERTVQIQSLAARLVSRRTSMEKEMPVLEAELAKYEAEEAADSVRLKMDVAAANEALTEKKVELLQQAIHNEREATAEQAVRKARREAITADPALKVYAEQNQVLAETSRTIAEALATTEGKLKLSTDTLDDLIRQLARTKKKVDAVGLTSSVGALLRKEKTMLPDVESRRISVTQRQELINETQYLLFEYEEQQQKLAEPDEVIEEILASANPQTVKNSQLLESAARELLKRKREYLDDLVRSTGQYFDTLIELDTIDRQIIKLEAEYENYIEQRVLWIRSGPALTSGVTIEESDAWLLSPLKWREAGLRLRDDAARNPALYLLCFGFLVPLLLRGRDIRNLLRKLGETAGKANCRSVVPTLRALGLTAILSAALPMGCFLIGWRLSRCAGDSEFTTAIAVAFKVVAILWLSIELIRQTCRPGGVGDSHFRWPSHVTSAIRREAKLAVLLLLPIAFVAATLASYGDIHERGDIQRLAYMLGMAIVAVSVFRLLRPSRLLRESISDKTSSIFNKLQYLMPVAGALLPTSLVALAAAGYFYTAQVLFWRLFATCMFVASLLVMRSVLYRMLLLRRRHLSMEQARQRSAAAGQNGETAFEKQPVAGHRHRKRSTRYIDSQLAVSQFRQHCGDGGRDGGFVDDLGRRLASTQYGR